MRNDGQYDTMGYSGYGGYIGYAVRNQSSINLIYTVDHVSALRTLASVLLNGTTPFQFPSKAALYPAICISSNSSISSKHFELSIEQMQSFLIDLIWNHLGERTQHLFGRS